MWLRTYCGASTAENYEINVSFAKVDQCRDRQGNQSDTTEED
ncbi:MAG: hypothetical protein AAF289_10985 [Cyanobacteria bacterium P01_A01_bin.135]